MVRSRLLEPGDMATPQRSTRALAQPRVRIYVGEADLGKVKPGMAARVQTDSQPDKPIAGKVGYISSVAEFTPKAVQTELRTSLVYERVLVDDPQGCAAPGAAGHGAHGPGRRAMNEASATVVAERLRKTFEAPAAARCVRSTTCRCA